MNRKAISPVVATALLLVVAVVAVVAFQTWFNNFQSGQLSDVEQRANAGASLTVERLEADGDLYVRNSASENVSISTISVPDGGCTELSSPGDAAFQDVTNYSLSGCTMNVGTAYDVVVVTSDGVFQANLLAR